MIYPSTAVEWAPRLRPGDMAFLDLVDSRLADYVDPNPCAICGAHVESWYSVRCRGCEGLLDDDVVTIAWAGGHRCINCGASLTGGWKQVRCDECAEKHHRRNKTVFMRRKRAGLVAHDEPGGGPC